MRLPAANTRAGRWLRFIVGGVVNTLFSYGVYLLLRPFMPYQAAYFVAYAAGIAFSYLFNAMVVFRVPLSWRGLLSFPLVYVAQYLASALLLGCIVEIGGLNATWAPLLVSAAMIPLTFLLSKLVLQRSARRREGASGTNP